MSPRPRPSLRRRVRPRIVPPPQNPPTAKEQVKRAQARQDQFPTPQPSPSMSDKVEELLQRTAATEAMTKRVLAQVERLHARLDGEDAAATEFARAVAEKFAEPDAIEGPDQKAAATSADEAPLAAQSEPQEATDSPPAA